MYQPRIEDKYISKIYLLKLKMQRPMTKILNDILDNYFKSLPENIETEEQKKR